MFASSLQTYVCRSCTCNPLPVQVVCFDPDAPSPENPVNRSFLHWVRANIPGNNVREGDVSKTICNFFANLGVLPLLDLV